MKPKLNPVAKASLIATLPEMTEIERAAFEKIPLRDAEREIAHHLAGELDAALQAAVERFVGAPVTSPEQIAGRLTHFSPDNNPQLGATFCMDGQPILRAGPITIQRHGDELHGSRQIEDLAPEASNA